MEKWCFILGLASVALLLLDSEGNELSENSICPWMFHRNSSCHRVHFLCFDGKCIHREWYCDGQKDCVDNSDEKYCNYQYECPAAMKRCPGSRKCILKEWFCDGIEHCANEADEKNCEQVEVNEQASKVRALQWLAMQKSSQSTRMWGSFVEKSTVALYLTSNTSMPSNRETIKEMTYEVTIQLLSRLSKRKLQGIPSTELASYVNAFLVTCLDPRKFHGIDLVQELRSRVDNQNYTNPYVLLSICNAGDTITESDKLKLIDAFWAKRREFWTDVQAVAVMALACASKQPGNGVDSKTLQEMTLELKQRQYRNGTVENLQTTALVLQALISAKPDADPDNFDNKKALQQILAMQKADGSFGSFQNTYYVLPVLNCKSLVNISSNHCEQRSTRDENSALDDLVTRQGPKIRVRYSLWIGNGRDVERNLALRVPAKTSFYGIMEIAAEIDSRYGFEYVVKSQKPYVNALSGFQDDPERGLYWFLYTFVEGNRSLSQKSPADIAAKDSDHFVMWYRSGSWTD